MIVQSCQDLSLGLSKLGVVQIHSLTTSDYFKVNCVLKSVDSEDLISPVHIHNAESLINIFTLVFLSLVHIFQSSESFGSN